MTQKQVKKRINEFCKCTHHKTLHNVDLVWTDVFFQPGKKILEHHICSSIGKIDFVEYDLYWPGSKTVTGETCPCKGFEPLRVEIET